MLFYTNQFTRLVAGEVLLRMVTAGEGTGVASWMFVVEFGFLKMIK